ncbi:hypothetical protein C8Q80DRAFT_284815 [Daedaleopsis nitida]|nr:hypothetical protein C8Q80DRAFT_284815 [Daedaleopsis nitida]
MKHKRFVVEDLKEEPIQLISPQRAQRCGLDVNEHGADPLELIYVRLARNHDACASQTLRAISAAHRPRILNSRLLLTSRLQGSHELSKHMDPDTAVNRGKREASVIVYNATASEARFTLRTEVHDLPLFLCECDIEEEKPVRGKGKEHIIDCRSAARTHLSALSCSETAPTWVDFVLECQDASFVHTTPATTPTTASLHDRLAHNEHDRGL